MRSRPITSGRFQCDIMENSVEARLATVSRELLKGTRVCCGLVHALLYAVLYPVPHRTRAVCSVHHVATANMEPTELRIGEKVVYLVNKAESVWDPLCFHRRRLVLWVCSAKG